uniref:Uncharacterized protein n=1 Tax=Rhizophora mucronata TaxID=61149 RepID=A0A2P2NC48_RHIMU
MSQRPKID